METIEIFFEEHKKAWYMTRVDGEDEETEDIVIISAPMASLLIQKLGLKEIAKNHFALKID